jgi:hypothetical protein
MDTLIAYLKMPTTWAGLGALLASSGVTVDSEILTAAGLGLVAVIQIFTDERKRK